MFWWNSTQCLGGSMCVRLCGIVFLASSFNLSPLSGRCWCCQSHQTVNRLYVTRLSFPWRPTWVPLLTTLNTAIWQIELNYCILHWCTHINNAPFVVCRQIRFTRPTYRLATEVGLCLCRQSIRQIVERCSPCQPTFIVICVRADTTSIWNLLIKWLSQVNTLTISMISRDG